MTPSLHTLKELAPFVEGETIMVKSWEYNAPTKLRVWRGEVVNHEGEEYYRCTIASSFRPWYYRPALETINLKDFL